MVIWSRGTKGQASCVYKAFTVDSSVQQVVTFMICAVLNCKYVMVDNGEKFLIKFYYYFLGLVVQLQCTTKQ